MSDREAASNPLPSPKPPVAGDMATRHTEAGRERGRRIVRAIAVAVVVKPMAVVVPVLTVPIFIAHVGVEGYGAYEAIASTVTWMGLANLGLGLSMVNGIISCSVSGDMQGARRIVSTVFFTTVALALVGLALSLLAALAINWPRVLSVDGNVILGLGSAIVVAGAAGLLTNIGSVAGGVYAGEQRLDRHNLWDGLAKGATLAACLCVGFLPRRVDVLVAAIALTPALVRLVNLASLFKLERPALSPRLADFSKARAVTLVREGAALLGLQLATVLLFQADRAILAVVADPRAVAVYSVHARLMLLPYGAYAMLLAPLWPAYRDALLRGDVAWAQRTHRLTLGLALLVAGGTVAAMLGAGPFLLRVLTRGDMIGMSLPLVLVMGAGMAIRMSLESTSILLNGAGHIRPQVPVLGLNALVSVAAAIVLGRWWGAIGVAAAFPLATLFTGAVGYRRLLREALAKRASGS
jgi:O-antigen/teichoic acid export membrane protein